MVEGGGTLTLRGAEPFLLANPTAIAGVADDETGVLSGVSLATPSVAFERPITDPVRATAFIGVDFSPLVPGGATGTVDADGNVLIRERLRVDLQIEVVLAGTNDALTLPGDCTTSPVAVDLRSTAPYDPETKTVTLADANFTVPPVVGGLQCDPVIAGAVNDELSGSGHAIELELVAPDPGLPLPPAPGCETVTVLGVSPVGPSVNFGDAVTLDAKVTTVADDPECAAAADVGDELGGIVDFIDGSETLASVPLDEADEATFTTSELRAGNRSLRARYRGESPFEASSSSEAVLLVTAEPAITTTLPPFVELGASPLEFDLTVGSSEFALPVEHARLDATLRRPPGDTGAMAVGSVVLEMRSGDTWVLVDFTSPASRTLLGAIGSAGDFDHVPGAEVTRRMRISTGAPAPGVGPVTVTFELVDGDAVIQAAPSPVSLASNSALTTIVPVDRVASSIIFGPVFAGGAVSPHTVRQGGQITLPSLAVAPNINGGRASGHVDVLLDGRPIGVTTPLNLIDPGFGPKAPVINGSLGTLVIQLPSDVPLGQRRLTVRYSGDDQRKSTQDDVSLTVLPATGTLYDCSADGASPQRFRALVEAQANLPATAPSGTSVPLHQMSVRVLTDRSLNTVNAFSVVPDAATTQVGEGALRFLDFELGPEGQGGATGLTRSFGSRMPVDPDPAPVTDVDHIVDLHGENGSAVISGDPGETVPVTLDAFEIGLQTIIGVLRLRCEPVIAPAELGQVTVSAVELAVSPGGPVRAGQAVALTASVFPSATGGRVEFRDGTDTLGVVPVVAGIAAMTTTELGAGSHDLTARLLPEPASAMLTSAVSPLIVLPRFDCEAFAEGGSAAVVRLVYMELLERCPDQAGFDFWTGSLDGGTSPAVFARAISNTSEAVGLVVDDAYRSVLGRNADPAGRAFWTTRLQASGRYDQLLADLAASSEFWARSGSTNAGFVTRVYDRLLGRAPEQSGLDFWVGRLDRGASPEALVLQLANLDEPLGLLVDAAYREILGRAPLSSERTNGITFLRATGDRSGLYAQLIGRPEFTIRAQGFPNPGA